MKRLILFLAIIFFSLVSILSAQNFKGKTEEPISISKPKRTLKVGEVLEYSFLGNNQPP